jgi:glycosyltransferase involved in cell wall biosynthesis
LLAIQYPDSMNPYTGLLRNALGEQGIAVRVIAQPLRFFLASLMGERPDVLHLHWVHPTSRNLLLSIIKFCLFQAGLTLFRLRHVRVFWTIHNLEFHEKRYRWLDRLNNRLVAGKVDAAFVHGKGVIPLVSAAVGLPADRIYYVPHGNYNGAIADIDGKVSAKRRGEGTAFLYFGLVRPYKGVLALIEQFRRLEGAATLTIAGDPQGAEMRRQVEEAARPDQRIRLQLGYLPDDELARLISACDVVVLPFKDVFTSGSLVMAITWGKPVIVPSLGAIREYVDDSCAVFYEANDDRGLSGALQAVLEMDAHQIAEKGHNARVLSAKLDWAVSGEKIAEVYRSYL